MSAKNPAAVALGRLGGKAGTGAAVGSLPDAKAAAGNPSGGAAEFAPRTDRARLQSNASEAGATRSILKPPWAAGVRSWLAPRKFADSVTKRQ